MEKKKCEFCGEIIHINTRRCPFCGSVVSEVPQEIISDEDSNVTLPPLPDENVQVVPGSSVEVHDENREMKLPETPMSNALKVFLTVTVSIIPGFGQLLGIILSIVFMSDEENEDHRSFGKALLIASLVIFGIVSLCCVAYAALAYSTLMSNPNFRLK